MTDVQWKDRKITNLSMNSSLQDSIPKGEIIERYCRTMYEIVSRVCPKLEPFEIVIASSATIASTFVDVTPAWLHAISQEAHIPMSK
jgi:hypothetical protein